MEHLIQIFKGISHYLYQQPLVEVREMRQFISKDYIPISTSKKVKAWISFALLPWTPSRVKITRRLSYYD